MRYADREPAPCHAIAGEGEIMVGIADQDDRGPRGAGRDPPGACSGGPPPDSRGAARSLTGRLRRRISQLDIRRLEMTRSTVFTSNRSQAVRLPKAVAFPADVHQVEIVRIGHSRLITPVGRRWDDLFLNGPRASADFMNERSQPATEEREPL